ncbi:MAG: PEP-CTERM system histidine kinase PrsK [Deltaproteobacteria bacterium]
MEYLNLLPLISALFCAGLALLTFIKRRWRPTAVAFTICMTLMALIELANFLTVSASGGEQIFFWKRASLVGEVLIAGNWLLFALVYAKMDAKRILKKWCWALTLAYLVPCALLLLALFRHEVFLTTDLQFIRLEAFARYLTVSLMIIVIAAMVILENTFRSSPRTERWKLKYTIFGVSAIFIFNIYILSQRLLYHVISINNIYLMSCVIIIANTLIIFGVFRFKIIVGDIYVSRKVLYNSASLFTIGIYLLTVGFIGHLIRSLKLNSTLPVNILFIFLSVLVLTVIFSSDRFKLVCKNIINKHFSKRKYDYREEWLAYSSILSKKLLTSEIADSFAHTLAERMFWNRIALWLVNESETALYLECTRNLAEVSTRIGLNDPTLSYLYSESRPMACSAILNNKKMQPISREISALIGETKAELLVPLAIAGKAVGLLTLGGMPRGEKFYQVDDYDLLKSVAAHAASAINSARLFEERMKARELEAFHRLSSFVMHDMKNATTMLSVLAQNAEKHLCDPEFQKDALQTISEAVNRMKRMIESLSSLPDKPKLELKDYDLNELINNTVNDLGVNGLAKLKIGRNLGKLSPVRVDAEEIQKVLHNLILNACEALDSEGQVEVSSRTNKDHVIFSVSDNGRGMSKEFMEKSLFKPFKSTKKKGLGIGLYQCKSIVEAHKGRIEVESELGEGTTFTVYLPTKQA